MFWALFYEFYQKNMQHLGFYASKQDQHRTFFKTFNRWNSGLCRNYSSADFIYFIAILVNIFWHKKAAKQGRNSWFYDSEILLIPWPRISSFPPAAKWRHFFQSQPVNFRCLPAQLNFWTGPVRARQTITRWKKSHLYLYESKTCHKNTINEHLTISILHKTSLKFTCLF